MFNDTWNFIKELVNPESIIIYGGFWFLLFIVYSETGLFVGFFLPGDSLLFTAGLFTATGIIDIHIFFVYTCIIIAAILGNITGYHFGKRAGKKIFCREKGLFFRPKHLVTAKEFYDKHGKRAIIIGAFLPIIRTFAPIVAGAVELPFKKFIGYSITGAVIWASTMVLSGYFLGKSFPEIGKNLPYIIITLIVVTSIPLIIAAIKRRIRNSKVKSEK